MQSAARPDSSVGRKARGNAGKAILIIFITLFLLTGISIGAYTYYILGFDTFYQGIYVDHIPLEGMTMAQAVQVVHDKHQPTLDAMNVILVFEDDRWEFGYQDMNARVNVEDVVARAYDIGRTGNFLQRLQEIYQTGKYGQTFETTITYDTSLLKRHVQEIAQEIYIEPVDASITFHNKQAERFTFTSEVIGRRISVDEVMTAIDEMVEQGLNGPYEIQSEELHPQYLLEEVKTWTSLLVTHHTVMTGTKERIHNITLSSSSFDGVRIDPGETFSLNEATGPRGLKDGYMNAPVIVRGVKLADEPGGGNCQTSTTFYGAAVRADLEIVERWHHSWPSSYTEVGQDAMVDYPGADLKIRNDKESPVFISRTISGDKIIVEIYGKQRPEYDRIDIITEILSTTDKPAEKVIKDPNLFEGETVVEYASRPGIKSQSYRVYYKDGKEVNRVKEAYSNYRRIQGQKRVGTKPRPVVQQPPAEIEN